MSTLNVVLADFEQTLADATAVGVPTVIADCNKGIADTKSLMSSVPTINSVPIPNVNVCVIYLTQNQGGAYQRFQNHVCFTTTAFSTQFHNIYDAKLAYPQYAMMVGDGANPPVERARVTVTGHEPNNRPTFVGNFGTEADGPYLFTIVPYDASGSPIASPTEQYVPYWMWIDRNSTAKNCPLVVFQNGSYEWLHGDPVFRWMLVPKTQLQERVEPLTWDYIPKTQDPEGIAGQANTQAGVPANTFYGGEPFKTALNKTNITRMNFMPGTSGMNDHRPAITRRGITVTENIQGYTRSHISGPVPQQPILDGPRGIATAYSSTSFWPGHSGIVYGMDPYSFYSIDQQGNRLTFAGLRHPQSIYWEEMATDANGIAITQADIPGIQYVGNWDPSIPQVRQFPWESWGLVFDSRTTVPRDLTLPPLDRPPFGLLPQHAGSGPRAFSTCRFGRILSYLFDKTKINAVPTITEWVSFGTLNDPWGLAINGNVLYVAERGAHKISMWSADTPNTHLGDLLSNPNGANFGSVSTDAIRRFVWLPQYTTSPGVPNLPLVRANNILAPEGIFVQDGYLYYGAYAIGEVRRVNLSTGVIQTCSRPYIAWTGQSAWIEVKLSDGTFGPRGTIFTTTWDNQYFGRPLAFLPNEPWTDTDGTTVLNSKVNWDYGGYALNVPAGPGGTESDIYATAVGINNGMMACASSGRDLEVFVQATLGESQPNQASAQRGYNYYLSKGYQLLHGNYGWGHGNWPLPWGENPDCDYWLTLSGHIKGP